MIEGVRREKQYGKRVDSKNKKGKYIKSKFSNSFEDIAIDATIRAAALRKRNRTKDFPSSRKESFGIKKEDIKEKIRKHGFKAAIVVVIDISGSMVSEEKLNRIKIILQKTITNVHINKDKLAVVGFKGKDYEIIIPNTKRPFSFLNILQKISIGGTTPMAAGLSKAFEISKQEVKKGEYLPMIIVLSDGVTNVGLERAREKNHSKSIRNKLEKNKDRISNPINNVLSIGEEIAKNEIHTVIVNFEKEKNTEYSVNRDLAKITNGRFYDLDIKNPLNDNILGIDSSKANFSDLPIDEILNYERDNI